jgi:hypothetical protein
MRGSHPAVNDSRAGGNWTGKRVDALTFGAVQPFGEAYVALLGYLLDHLIALGFANVHCLLSSVAGCKAAHSCWRRV